jgi:hypothetical protein
MAAAHPVAAVPVLVPVPVVANATSVPTPLILRYDTVSPYGP